MIWPIKKIKDVALVTAGQSPEGIYYNDQGEGLPFYQGKKEFTEKYIGEAKVWTTKVTKIAQIDDVLMSVRAPVGPVNFATQQCCIGRGLASIRVTENFDKDFLFLFFKHIENELTGNTGAVFNSINKSQIENISIPLPSISEQQQIVEKLDTAFDLIDRAKANIEKNIQNAKELFQSKLNQVFSEKGEGWEANFLQNLTEVKDGTHDSPKYIAEGIPFVTQKNITKDGLCFNNTKFIKEEDHLKFYKRSNVYVGDILISMIGANRGMTAIVDDERMFSIKNVGLIKNGAIVSNDFLLLFLKSTIALNYIKESSKGGAQEFVGLTALRNFLILYPVSKKTQQNIVNQFDQISLQTNLLQEKYKLKLSNLVELKKSILEKAFKGELI